MKVIKSMPAFELGNVVLSVLAKKRIEENGLNPVYFVNRHVHCDWSELNSCDRVLNQKALEFNKPVVSAYRISPDQNNLSDFLYVLTKADRSETRILHSEEITMIH